ncbi:hypothetical protein EVAR_68592_1 [Eumeta japonica]|uniref:Uncharacterized protein n=1 Tax=Eumeta variegata TaxID=151549 RepID=A0A4C2A8Z7_EUMVA|nr:hypothetical protein EVAR_68592_1 [Eumeta japonica]
MTPAPLPDARFLVASLSPAERSLSRAYKPRLDRFKDILSMEIPPWIINPFDETEVENVILQKELLELSTNEELKVTFKRGYQKFWL